MNEFEKMEMTSYFNCLQAALCYFCDKYAVNPVYLFLNSYGIEYSIKHEDMIGAKMRSYIPVGFERCFEDIYGFTFDKITIDVDHIEGDMSMKMNGDGILIGDDAFFCPWSEAFSKFHIAHFCIVKSVDIENKILICADPYLKREDVAWPTSMFSRGPFVAYNLKAKPCKKEVTLAVADKVLFTHLSKRAILLNYKEMINDFRNANRKEDLFEDPNPNNCKLIICSKQISNSYKGLALMFYQMLAKSEKTEEKESELLLEMLFRVGDMWAGLNLVFIKMVLNKVFNIGKVKWITETFEKIRGLDLNIVDFINKMSSKDIY